MTTTNRWNTDRMTDAELAERIRHLTWLLGNAPSDVSWMADAKLEMHWVTQEWGNRKYRRDDAWRSSFQLARAA